MEKTINCAECNVEYSYTPNPNYPDKRKYCANCSEKKKAEFEHRGSAEAQEDTHEDEKPEVVKLNVRNDGPPKLVKDNGVKKESGEYQSTVYNRTVAPNSYEVGSAGNRFKLYFETAEDLKEKMQELRDAGLMDIPDDIVTGE